MGAACTTCAQEPGKPPPLAAVCDQQLQNHTRAVLKGCQQCDPLQPVCALAEQTLLGPQKRKAADSDEWQAGQMHVVEYLQNPPDFLSEDDLERLQMQFKDLQVPDLEEAFVQAIDAMGHTENEHEYSPPTALSYCMKKPPKPNLGANFVRAEHVPSKFVALWRNRGMALLAAGQVGVLLLAGGLDGDFGAGVPKACCDIGLQSQKCVFQIFCERIRRMQHLVCRRNAAESAKKSEMSSQAEDAEDKKGRPDANQYWAKKEEERKKRQAAPTFFACHIPLYIMCSEQNADAIHIFFEENSFFGLPPKDVLFLVQDDIPVFDARRCILLEDCDRLMMAPAGNGGVFRAFMDGGMADAKLRDVEWIQICSVDNLLTRCADPIFVGLIAESRVGIGVKAVTKFAPEDKLGCFTNRTVMKMTKDGGDQATKFPAMIEYDEMPWDMRVRAAKGNRGLMFEVGNTCQYMFPLSLMERAVQQMGNKWHGIRCAVAHYDVELRCSVPCPGPDEPNAIRLERFAADGIELVEMATALVVDRELEYVSFKSWERQNSVPLALNALSTLHQRWLLDAGAKFLDNVQAGEQPELLCEVSPLVSYEGEDLLGYTHETIHLPFYAPGSLESGQERESITVRKHSGTKVGEYCASKYLLQHDLEISMERHEFLPIGVPEGCVKDEQGTTWNEKLENAHWEQVNADMVLGEERYQKALLDAKDPLKNQIKKDFGLELGLDVAAETKTAKPRRVNKKANKGRF